MYSNPQVHEEFGSKKILLVDQSTWLPWINVIKAKALRGSKENVWQYIDPSKSVEPELPQIPDEPEPKDVSPGAQTIMSLNQEQFARLQYLERRHALKVSNISQILNSIREIDSYIMGSIQLDNELWTRDVTSTWALLRALQKRLAPTNHSKKAEVIRSYNALKVYDKSQPVDRFLYNWERVYGLALALNIPDVMEERPLYDFALSIQEIDKSYATNLELRIDENIRNRSLDKTVNIIQLDDVIEEFRNFYNRHQAIARINTPFSFAASQNEVNSSQRPCLCGDNHLFKDCLYLNRRLRPSGWVGKEHIYHKINLAIEDPRRIKIKTLIKKTTDYDGLTKGFGNKEVSISNGMASTNCIASEYETEELKNFISHCPSNFASLAAADTENNLKNSWILDGGSDVHVCNNITKWGFVIVRNANKGEIIRAGNAPIPIEAYGTVKLKVDTPYGKKHITLRNVILARGFLANVVSMQLLNQQGFHWSSRTPTKLECEDRSVACILYQNGGHVLFNNPNTEQCNKTALMARLNHNPTFRTITETNLHRVLAHASPEVISHIHGPDHGINIDKLERAPEITKCMPCSLAKSKRIVSRQGSPEVPRSGSPFHTLFWDAITMEEAFNGDRYVSHFYCPDSKFNFTFTCRAKTEFKYTLRTTLQLIKKQWDYEVQILRLDGETSLIQECKKITNEHGIICNTSAARTPEQNGAAERSGGVIIIKARAMGLDASLPTNLWPETVRCAGYIANRTPINQLGWKSPFEVVHGVKPSYAHLHIFGCRAYALDKNISSSKKLNSRAHLGHLVGYDSTNIFRIWIPSKNKVLRTRDATFDDEKFYDPKELDLGAIVRDSHEDIIQTIGIHEWEDVDDISENEIFTEIPSNPLEPIKVERKGEVPVQEKNNMKVPSKIINGDIDVKNIVPGKRARNKAVYATFHNSFAAAQNSVKICTLHRSELPPAPKNHKEVLRHQFSIGFINAEEKEFNTLIKKELFHTINKQEIEQMKTEGKLDLNLKTLPLMWVYNYKFDADGYLQTFKARLVARGDLQHTTEETYAATLAAQVFRAAMAVSAAFDYKIRQYDIVAAYTNANLMQPIVAHMPDGFHKEGQFLLVMKALYGLPESALLWQNHLQATLINIGLYPVPGVSCLFKNDRLTVLFYVDDIIAIYHEKDNAIADSFEKMLMKEYQTKPLGQIDHFLGIRVVRDEVERKIWLVQDSYIDTIAHEFNIKIESNHTPSTPLPASPLTSNNSKATIKEIVAYQRRVGKLNYAAVITRPDIAFGVSKLSEFLQNPSSQHIEAAEHMMKYLVATKSRGIEYDGKSINEAGRTFIASSDAAFADNVQTRCSSSGFCFQVFKGMIHWKAVKQKTVTTSSTEAELLALTITAKEYIWWMRLFDNLNYKFNSPVILCDNQQTLRLLQKETPRLATKLKHVDIHQCWLRQEVQNGRIKVEWVATDKMIADGLTKSLPPQKHQIFVKLMNLVEVRV